MLMCRGRLERLLSDCVYLRLKARAFIEQNSTYKNMERPKTAGYCTYIHTVTVATSPQEYNVLQDVYA